MGRYPREKSLRAFTLIELMLVIAILGILSTIVAAGVFGHLVEAQQATARANIKTLGEAVHSYRLNHHKLPESLEVLLEPCNERGGEPYIENSDIFVDPWDFEYLYLIESASRFEIKSLGSDHLEGGEGSAMDISSKDTRWRQD